MPHIPPIPPHSAPILDDARCSLPQLRARVAVRLAIARQDAEAGDTLAYQRNVAEAARLERLIEARESGG